MNERELDILLLRYLDGALSTEETATLSEILERDAAARLRLREMTEQAFAVGEAGRCREARTPNYSREAETVLKTKLWWQRRELWWMTAAALVVCGAFLAWRPRSPEPLLEVVAVQGAATWSDGGERLPLVAGAKLAAGTIETESEMATAEIRFADGTRFTLHGSAEAVFSESDHKQVMLKRGTFTASVARQALDRPLRVRTTAAEVEVLGTIFTLDALPQHTDLSVAEGRVRLKRLVDGREVEVAAQQRVAASFVTTDGLTPQPLHSPATTWQLDLSTAPPRLTGVWHAASADEIARIDATPTVERRRQDGSVFVHNSVIVRAESNSVSDAFASLTDDSVLRVKLRLTRAVPLQLMIATRRPDGGFAGNFELVKLHPELVGDENWHTLDVPLQDFKSLHHDRANVAAGNLANVVIVTTLHESVGLTVAGISILPAPDTPLPAP